MFVTLEKNILAIKWQLEEIGHSFLKHDKLEMDQCTSKTCFKYDIKRRGPLVTN